MVHFPAYLSDGLCVHPPVAVIQTTGLPHSDICGSSVVGTSPQLFAAIRVLRRLAAPRHPPWTLFHLTILSFQLPFAKYFKKLGLTRLELVTSCLSGTRSNHLSYSPKELYQ